MINGHGSKINLFETKFTAAVIKNKEFTTSARRLTWDKRAAILRHLYTPKSSWKNGKGLLAKTSEERKTRYTALKYYKLIGTTLYRKAKEKVIKDGVTVLILEHRVVLDDNIYYLIKNAHSNLNYLGRDKTFKLLETNYFYISREEVN